MSFPYFIAKRYLISKSSNNAINIIAGISILGVILGTMALSIVLAGFSGLKTFSLSFLDASDPDLRISSAVSKSFDQNQAENILNDDRIKAYSFALEERAFFAYKNKQVVAYLKGVDSSFSKISNIPNNLIVGNWVANSGNQVVLGNGISGQLALGILNYGDPLRVVVPKPGTKYITNIETAFNRINTQAVGVIASSEEVDNSYVFTNLSTIQELLQLPSTSISEINIRLEDPSGAEEVKSSFKEMLGADFKIETREELNAVFYRMLNTENMVSYLIFTFIVVIALFNVIGALIMIILDKKSNLKTLFSLGAETRDIRRIFLWQGVLLTFIGMFIGIGISSTLLFLQQRFELFMITPNIAYPVEIKWENTLLVLITIGLLGYIASQIAVARISKKFIENLD